MQSVQQHTKREMWADPHNSKISIVLDSHGTQVHPFLAFLVLHLFTDLSFSLGFFIGDVLMSMILWEIYGFSFIFHGLCGLSGFTWALAVQKDNELQLKFAAFALLWESSTPFLNNIYILKHYFAGWDILRTVNGILLVVTFFTTRIAIGGVMSVEILEDIRVLHERGGEGGMALSERAAMTFWVVGLGILNCFWLYKLAKGFVKVVIKMVNGSNHDSKSESHPKSQ